MKKTSDKFWLWAFLAAGAVVLCLLLLISVRQSQGQSGTPYQPTRASTQPPTVSTALPTDGSAAPDDPTQPPTQNTQAPETQPQQQETQESQESQESRETQATEPPPSTQETEPVPTEDPLAQQGLTILDIGSYTGAFVEDGSDEIVSGVAMLVLENHSGEAIQYAQILLHDGDQTLTFTLSTLPDGETIVVLEQDRQEYREGANYVAELSSLALFDTPPSLQEDLLEIQTLDGAVNITNISGADIDADIVIYYKNRSQDLLYGGITYRIRIQGGLGAAQIQQIMAQHFTAESRIMFVTIG